MCMTVLHKMGYIEIRVSLVMLGFAAKGISSFLIYLFSAALGLCCWAFSSCGERGLLTVVASPVSEHRLQGMWVLIAVALRFSSCKVPDLRARTQQ